MSVVGLKQSEQIASSINSKVRKVLLQHQKEMKEEVSKLELLLNDKNNLRNWRTGQADSARVIGLYRKLDDVEKLYLEAGDTNAGRIFKERMTTQLKQKLTNLKANQLEVKIKLKQFEAQTRQGILNGMTNVRREGTAREMYSQSRSTGGFLSNFGKAFVGDLVTLETKAAGSKTLGEYMQNLYNTYEAGLKDVFVNGIVRGDSYSKMIQNLQKKTNITAGKANLLIRTEANAIFNDSVKGVIESNPLVKGYRFRAVLDSRTSDICQKHDGEFIPKDSIQPGINYPPLHPNCRSTVTTVLYDEDERKDTVQRYTKNRSNQWIKVPPGMKYNEFKLRMSEFSTAEPDTYIPRSAPAISTPEAQRFLTQIKAGNFPTLNELRNSPVVQQIDAKAIEATNKYGYTAQINTPERIQQRKDWGNQFLKMGSAVKGSDGRYTFKGDIKKEHKMVIVTGLPAAGKSTIIANPVSEKLGAFIFDSDEVKQLIPEFSESGGAAANSVHEESKKILADAKNEFLTGSRNGDNLIVPIIGDELESLQRKWIKPFEDAGYDIEVKFREADPAQSLARSMGRAIETGRIIPMKVLLEYEDNPRKVFEILKGMKNKKGVPYVR